MSPQQQPTQHTYKVRGDATPGPRVEGGPGNGQNNYDVLNLIAEKWLQLNPDAISVSRGKNNEHTLKLPKSKWARIDALVKWIAQENGLIDKQGRMCDDVNFTAPLIHRDQILKMPMDVDGTTQAVVNPEQGGPCGRALDCLKKQPKPPEKPVMLVPPIVIPPTTPAPAPKAELAPLPEVTPHFTARQADRSSEAANIRVGSLQEAFEATAKWKMGDNLAFATEHYSLRNITPVYRAKKEKKTAETTNFTREGDNRGSNGLSERDDATMAPNNYMNGKNRAQSDKGRPFTNGYVTEIDENGVMSREDKTRLSFVKDGNYAFTALGTVQHPGFSHRPVGVALSNPSNQLSTFSKTSHYGLTQTQAMISKVSLGGFNSLIANQHSWAINKTEVAERIKSAGLYNARGYRMDLALEKVEAATGDNKIEPATELLTLLRDRKSARMLVATDSKTNGAVVQDEYAIHQYLIGQGISAEKIAQINKDIQNFDKYPETLPLPIDEKDVKTLKDRGIPQSRIGTIDPKKLEITNKIAVNEEHSKQNSVELEIAQLKSVKLDEKAAVSTARETLVSIANNKEATLAFGEFVRDNRSGGIEFGQALSDILKNPQNYALPKSLKEDPKKYGLSDKEVSKGVFTKESSVKWVQTVLGDERKSVKTNTQPDDYEKDQKSKKADTEKKKLSEAAFDDVYQLGETPRGPFIKDKPFAVSRPDLIGKAAFEQLQKKPELFSELVTTITSNADQTVTKHNKKGLSDGRSHSVALVHALGAQRVNASAARNMGLQENDDAPALAKIMTALGHTSTEAKNTFRGAVRDVTAYTESGASGYSQAGYSVNAREWIDNTLVAEQNLARHRGDVDANRAFSTLFTSKEAVGHGAPQFMVEGLKAHPALARDAILATMAQNPQVFTNAEAYLKVLDKSLNDKLEGYDSLRAALKETHKAFASGDKKKAVEAYGDFFIQLESDIDRSERLAKDGKRKAVVPNNWAAQKNNAWDQFLGAIAQDPKASLAVINAAGKHTALRDAFLGAATDAAFMDNQNEGHLPKVKAVRTGGDALYQSALFTLPTDKRGEVDEKKGFLNLKNTKVTVNEAYLNALTTGNNDIATSAALFVPQQPSAAPVVAPMPSVAALQMKVKDGAAISGMFNQNVFNAEWKIINGVGLDALKNTTVSVPKNGDATLVIAQQLAAKDPTLASGSLATSSDLYLAVKGLQKQGILTTKNTTGAGGKSAVAVGVTPLVAAARDEAKAHGANASDNLGNQAGAGAAVLNNGAGATQAAASYQKQIDATDAEADIKVLMGKVMTNGHVDTLKLPGVVTQGGEVKAITKQLIASNAEFKAVDSGDLRDAVSALQKAGLLTVSNQKGKVHVVVSPAQAAGVVDQQATPASIATNTADLSKVAITSGIHQLLIGHHGGLEKALAQHDSKGNAAYTPAQQAQVRAQAALLLGSDAFSNLQLGSDTSALAIAKALAAKDKTLGEGKKLNENSLLVKTVHALLDGNVLANDGKGSAVVNEQAGVKGIAVTGVALSNEQELVVKQAVANMNAAGMTLNNELGTNASVLLGKVPAGTNAAQLQELAKAQLALLITAQTKSNPLLQNNPALQDAAGITAMANQLIDSGAINVTTKAGELLAVPNQQGIEAAKAVDGKLNMGAGINTNHILVMVGIGVIPFVVPPAATVVPQVPVLPEHLSKAAKFLSF